MDDIRKRKGLPTDEKVVKDATKQRTVTRSLAREFSVDAVGPVELGVGWCGEV